MNVNIVGRKERLRGMTYQSGLWEMPTSVVPLGSLMFQAALSSPPKMLVSTGSPPSSVSCPNGIGVPSPVRAIVNQSCEMGQRAMDNEI